MFKCGEEMWGWREVEKLYECKKLFIKWEKIVTVGDCYTKRGVGRVAVLQKEQACLAWFFCTSFFEK